MATPRAPYRSVPGTESNNKCLAAIPARRPCCWVTDLFYDQRDGWIHCEWLDIGYVTRELAAVRQSCCVSNKMIAAMRKQIRTGLSFGPALYDSVCPEQIPCGQYGPVTIGCHWPNGSKKKQTTGLWERASAYCGGL